VKFNFEPFLKKPERSLLRPCFFISMPSIKFVLKNRTKDFFGAQYTAWILVPSSSALRLPGLHVDFTTELEANLCSDGTFAFAITHWITLTNFIPIYTGFQGFGLTSAREALCYANMLLLRYPSFAARIIASFSMIVLTCFIVTYYFVPDSSLLSMCKSSKTFNLI